MALLHADSAQASWDAAKSKWLIRIHVGGEVIRRHCNNLPHAAAEDAIRSAAVQTAHDEGYELGTTEVTVQQ